jgi:hypothetical protein
VFSGEGLGLRSYACSPIPDVEACHERAPRLGAAALEAVERLGGMTATLLVAATDIVALG